MCHLVLNSPPTPPKGVGGGEFFFLFPMFGILLCLHSERTEMHDDVISVLDLFMAVLDLFSIGEMTFMTC